MNTRVRFRWPALVALAAAAAACGKSSPASGGGDSAKAAGTAAAAGAAAVTVSASDGRAVFTRTCATCHQQNGQGVQGAFPPLALSEIATGDKPRFIRLVLHGLSGAITVKGQRYNNVMPPWKTLSDADMAAVLSYVRTNFGNAADSVTAAEVAAERAATASRTAMWTPRELGLE